MRRLIVIAALPCVLAGTKLPAQQVPTSQAMLVGARVRVHYRRVGNTVFSAPPTITGRLVALTPDSMSVAAGGDTTAISQAAITGLEAPLEHGTSEGRGAGLGAVLGALAGGVLGGATWHPCTETGWFACFMYPSQGEQIALGAVGGAAGGALLGLIIGSMIPAETWVPVNRSGVQIGLAPGVARVTLRF
jgi:hypothetical protein